VKSPSLYYHFNDKAELLSEVARQILLNVRYPDASVGGWEERVIALCVATRRSLLSHPNAAPLLLQFFPRHLLLGAYETAVKGYPFTRDIHMTILEGLEKLTIGSALFEASARTRKITSMPEVDAASYPNLAESVAANPFEDEALFVEAVQMFLAGVKARTVGLRRKSPSL
jgi:AcrR family transcriptional regulator